MVFAQSPFICFAAVIAAIGLISLILRAVLQSGRRDPSLPPGDFPCLCLLRSIINWLTIVQARPQFHFLGMSCRFQRAMRISSMPIFSNLYTLLAHSSGS